MESKAKEMMAILGDEWTIYDYECLAVMTLISIAGAIPEIKYSVKRIIGILVDAEITTNDIKSQLANGILPFRGKPKASGIDS